MDLSTIVISYEYGEGDTAEQQEILRNVRTILSTPIGTCPLYRDFGIKMTCLSWSRTGRKSLSISRRSRGGE